MDVIPAVDIRGGRCVRLFQGDYARETVYDDDPVRVARRWQDTGASTVHVVDLDAARTGEPVNLSVVQRIAALLEVPVQVGGGVRDLASAERLLNSGVARVVFGTVAVQDPSMVAKAVERWGDRIAVSIDARDGKATTDGWQRTSERGAIDLGRELSGLGVAWVIYTDISRDGTLTEPNYAAMAEMVSAVPSRVIASGGVGTLEHLRSLDATGVAAAIVGRALFAGTLDLAEALDWSRTESRSGGC